MATGMARIRARMTLWTCWGKRQDQLPGGTKNGRLSEKEKIVNILDLIGKDVKLVKNGKVHVGLCPFHKEKTPSFRVSVKANQYFCFGCHAGGDMVSYLVCKDGMSVMEAMEYIAEKSINEEMRKK